MSSGSQVPQKGILKNWTTKVDSPYPGKSKINAGLEDARPKKPSTAEVLDYPTPNKMCKHPFEPPSPIEATSPDPPDRCNCAVLFPRTNVSLPTNINSTLGKIGTPFPVDGLEIIDKSSTEETNINSTIEWLDEPPKPIAMNPDSCPDVSFLKFGNELSERRDANCCIPTFKLNFNPDSYFDQDSCMDKQDQTL